MEASTSGHGEALLVAMRALARRGAWLQRAPNGEAAIEQTDRKRQSRPVRPDEFMHMLDAGWLRSCGDDRFAISRRGATALRALLNRQAATGAAKSVSECTPSRNPPAAQTRSRSQNGVAATPGCNSRESPLAWLRQRRDTNGTPLIQSIEFDAGERLRADFERSMLAQRVTASWDPTGASGRQARGAPGAGLEMSEMVVLTRQRVEAALAAVGPELGGMLLDVCCYLKGLEQAERNGGWPRRAGKVVLQLGLAHLARHYGLDRRCEASTGRVRSWGAEGFRPGIDPVPRTGDTSPDA